VKIRNIAPAIYGKIVIAIAKAINIPINDLPNFSSNFGNLFNNNFEPSSGGIGIKLNNARNILM
jgi:hypothetical protein